MQILCELFENVACSLSHTSPLLDLPGEIRNKIMRLCLVSDKAFTIKLRFPSFDTSLMRVNKRIYEEASSIFYHENVFRFPQTIFVATPIRDQLRLFGLSQNNLTQMRRFILDIPISSSKDNKILTRQTSENLGNLWNFIKNQCGKNLQVRVNYHIAWGSERVPILPRKCGDILPDFDFIKKKGRGVIQVNVETQSWNLDAWVDILVSTHLLCTYSHEMSKDMSS